MLMVYREMEIEDRWNGCVNEARRLAGTLSVMPALLTASRCYDILRN